MEAINNVQNKTRFTPKFIASVGILSGISIVLMQILEFPIPFMPPFLKFDFSTLPALIGGFAYGPVTGIAIAFIKAALHLLRTDTGGVGELADFLASGSLVFVSSLIFYKRIKTRKGAVFRSCSRCNSNVNRRRTCKLLYLDTVLYKRYAYGANYIALRQG